MTPAGPTRLLAAAELVAAPEAEEEAEDVLEAMELPAEEPAEDAELRTEEALEAMELS